MARKKETPEEKEKRLDRKTFRFYLRRLRAKFPLSLPVLVRVGELPKKRHEDDCATCYLWGNHYRILIDINLNFQGRCDSLIEEWSHIVDIDRHGSERVLRNEKSEHSKTRWGPIRAEVYNVMLAAYAEVHTEETNG